MENKKEENLILKEYTGKVVQDIVFDHYECEIFFTDGSKFVLKAGGYEGSKIQAFVEVKVLRELE